MQVRAFERYIPLMAKEEMHLQEIYYPTFDLDLEFKVRKVVTQYHLQNLTYWYVSIS